MDKLLIGQVVRSWLTLKSGKWVKVVKGNPLRKLHESINKRQGSLILNHT
jgi:hypothetical protein